MKFRTKQQLLEANQDAEEWTDGFSEVLDEAFNSFAERVEFYKKYKNNQYVLKRYEPEIYKVWEKFSLYEEENYAELYKKDETFEVTTYSNWLLDYCFGDVMKNAIL